MAQFESVPVPRGIQRIASFGQILCTRTQSDVVLVSWISGILYGSGTRGFVMGFVSSQMNRYCLFLSFSGGCLDDPNPNRPNQTPAIWPGAFLPNNPTIHSVPLLQTPLWGAVQPFSNTHTHSNTHSTARDSVMQQHHDNNTQYRINPGPFATLKSQRPN